MYADASFLREEVGHVMESWLSMGSVKTALCTTECEVMGFMEAMVMGDSVSAVLDCLEGWLPGDAETILYGDSLNQPRWSMAHSTLKVESICLEREGP